MQPRRRHAALGAYLTDPSAAGVTPRAQARDEARRSRESDQPRHDRPTCVGQTSAQRSRSTADPCGSPAAVGGRAGVPDRRNVPNAPRPVSVVRAQAAYEIKPISSVMAGAAFARARGQGSLRAPLVASGNGATRLGWIVIATGGRIRDDTRAGHGSPRGRRGGERHRGPPAQLSRGRPLAADHLRAGSGGRGAAVAQMHVHRAPWRDSNASRRAQSDPPRSHALESDVCLLDTCPAGTHPRRSGARR